MKFALNIVDGPTLRETPEDADINCDPCLAPCCKTTWVVLMPAEVDDFAHVIHPELGFVLLRDEDGSCVYLEGRRCGVYDRRPHVCAHYSCVSDDRLTAEMRYGR